MTSRLSQDQVFRGTAREPPSRRRLRFRSTPVEGQVEPRSSPTPLMEQTDSPPTPSPVDEDGRKADFPLAVVERNGKSRFPLTARSHLPTPPIGSSAKVYISASLDLVIRCLWPRDGGLSGRRAGGSDSIQILVYF